MRSIRHARAALLLILGGAVWAGCGGRAETSGAADLVSQLDAADADGQLEICMALAAERDSALSRILEAFDQAAGKPRAQVGLVKAVAMMEPSEPRRAAIVRIRSQAKDEPVRQVIDRFAFELSR